MTRVLKFIQAVSIVIGVQLAAPPAQAQTAYSQAELEQMLAPIALYPDAILSQALMAATRPLEVVEAARWTRANPGLQGDDAVRAAQFEPWDPSVKSLLAFPQLLARMDENLDWTKALGHAFFVQEPVVMDTIQYLRQRARTAGQLASDERVTVIDEGSTIYIQPASPQFVYLPYYDPWVAYGAWRWPTYPPVAWAPWPGYVVVHRPGVLHGLWWGPAIGVSAALMYNRFDWRQRRVYAPHSHGLARPPSPYRESQPSQRARSINLTPAPTPQQAAAPQRVRPALQDEHRGERRAARDRRSDPAMAVMGTQPPQTIQPRVDAPVRMQPRVDRTPPQTIQRRMEAPVPAQPRIERAPLSTAPVRSDSPPAERSPRDLRAADAEARRAPHPQRAAQVQRAPSDAAREAQREGREPHMRPGIARP